MGVLHPRCCGLDVHKATVLARARRVIDGNLVKEVRTFSTTTAHLIALSEWLTETNCTHVAMEATGVYWKPVWHILSHGGFEPVLANAAHIKNAPGRKSDVKDADWISDLLAHGLIRVSFVPDSPTQEIRNLLKTRNQIVHEKAHYILRFQKTQEDANIKLESLITDIMGLSGRKIIEALIAGEGDPAKLAALPIHGSLRGRVTAQHRLLLRLHLEWSSHPFLTRLVPVMGSCPPPPAHGDFSVGSSPKLLRGPNLRDMPAEDAPAIARLACTLRLDIPRQIVKAQVGRSERPRLPARNGWRRCPGCLPHDPAVRLLRFVLAILQRDLHVECVERVLGVV